MRAEEASSPLWSGVVLALVIEEFPGPGRAPKCGMDLSYETGSGMTMSNRAIRPGESSLSGRNGTTILARTSGNLILPSTKSCRLAGSPRHVKLRGQPGVVAGEHLEMNVRRPSGVSHWFDGAKPVPSRNVGRGCAIPLEIRIELAAIVAGMVITPVHVALPYLHRRPDRGVAPDGRPPVRPRW